LTDAQQRGSKASAARANGLIKVVALQNISQILPNRRELTASASTLM
jgi:hypothetical protein